MSATTASAGRRVTPTARLVLGADAPREEWLAARRDGLGSSDIAAVLGLSTRATPSSVYYDKRGMLPLDDGDVGEAALWGQVMEAPIAQEWQRRNRTVVRRVGIVAHVDEPWMRCTLDRRCLECPKNRGEREQCAVEIKTRSAFVADRWRRGVPDDVLAQVLWQIAVCGYEHIHTFTLIGGNDPRQHTVHRAEYADIIADIVAGARRFWVENVQGERVPELDTERIDSEIETMAKVAGARDGVVALDDDPEVYGLLMAYQQSHEAAKPHLKAKDAAKAKLLRRLGTHRTAKLGNELAYSMEPCSKRSPRLDDLAQDHPAIFEEYVSDKTFDRFTIGPDYKIEKD